MAYTKAEKIAYGKKMRAERAKKKAPAKKAPKKVVKQNQFRVEYKDRISPVVNDTLAAWTASGSITDGPKNSLIMVPSALTKLFSTGTLNGEIDGNNFNPRFLNMKVKLSFDELLNNHNSLPIKYNIQIYQGLVLQDLREYLNTKHTNTSSGRDQPAFSDHTLVPGYWEAIAKKFIFNSNIKADFLTYEKS